MTDSEYDRMVDEERLATISRLEQDLAAAKAVLDGARVRSALRYEDEGLLVVTLDRAAWLAWQEKHHD